MNEFLLSGSEFTTLNQYLAGIFFYRQDGSNYRVRCGNIASKFLMEQLDIQPVITNS